MDIHSLGFVRLESTVVEQWRSFATDVLGALVTDGPDGSLHLRLDDRPVRVAIVPGERDRLIGAAFEVRDRLALETAVAELEAAGVAVKEGSTDEAAARRVEKFVAFDDPNGNPVELFFSQSVDGLDVQLPHGGAFLTGALGMGHVVLPSADIEAAFDFYTRVLGFRHRDSMAITFPNGMQVRLRFLGCNARHHSVALTQTQSEQGMRHMMLEADSIKTFGRTYARAREAGALKTEMGQHSNDEVLSFYLNCPGGFEIEYGVHGRHVDDATWLTRDLTALSYWGYWPAAKLEPTV
ncbi:MAG: 3,4-dihydroxy-9,10-secoandrosta,3,5(10)-triene-9,17-dione 4,5-dioxygenase [Pseudonocardiales bacterium]|nr:3,4-dihydroxy-9,10-secoandrosta,3,5(10)-triene-9,17-dione 4,5-dioxygenase [Pseudonocardiales bacterium]